MAGERWTNVLRDRIRVRSYIHLNGWNYCLQSRFNYEATRLKRTMCQESCIDPMGSYVVYAPIEATFLHRTVAGEDSSTVSILPSGFTITGDGLVNTDRHGAGRRSKGSLLTVAFQILVCSGSTMSPLNMDSLASVKTHFMKTIEKNKAALDCSHSSDDDDED